MIAGLVALAVSIVVLTAAAPAAHAQAPVPCRDIGGGKYECDWWRPGDGRTSGSMVVSNGQIVGYLHQGRNWIYCQQPGARVRSADSRFTNVWYGWTLSDRNWAGKNELGWVSALDARGGANDGPFGGFPGSGGVPDCRALGVQTSPVPSVEGIWETTPPGGGAPPAPPPPKPPQPPQGEKQTMYIDHRPYRPGQALTFQPHGAGCTGGFILERPGEGSSKPTYWGLSAGHCPGGPADRVWREGPQSESLGNVWWNAEGWGIDALLFGQVGAGLSRARQEIERGSDPRRRLRVTGIRRSGQLHVGDELCFAGRSSGADECGPLTTEPNAHLLCIEEDSKPGDSGGPVYTHPTSLFGASLPVQAVGIVTYSPVRAAARADEAETCFTPIDEIMQIFDATFPVHKAGGRGPALVQAVRAAQRLTRQSGLRLRVRLGRRATVRVQVRRAGRGSSRAGRWHTARFRGRRGWNSFRVGTLGGRRLQRGRYHATVRARARNVGSTAWRLAFRIR